MGAFVSKLLVRSFVAIVAIYGAWTLADSSHDRKEFADEHSDAIQEILEVFPGAGPFPYVRHGQGGDGTNNDTIEFVSNGMLCRAEIDRWQEEVVVEPSCVELPGIRRQPSFTGKGEGSPDDASSPQKVFTKIGNRKRGNRPDARESAAAILADRDIALQGIEAGLGKRSRAFVALS